MRLEICCCNMYRYLQKTNGDPKIEGHMLLENSVCVLISWHQVGHELCQIYTHIFFTLNSSFDMTVITITNIKFNIKQFLLISSIF